MMSSRVCTQFIRFHFWPNLQRTFTYLPLYVLFIILNYWWPVASLRFCYFRRTATLRTNIAKFQIADIDYTLCTHYVYGYAQIDNISRTIVAQDPTTEEGTDGLYRQFVTAKIRFPSIKTMLSLGGPGIEAVRQLESMGRNDMILQGVALSVVPFLRMRGFDGLEVDWATYTETAKNTHARLLTMLREKFDADVSDSKLILTATGSGIEEIITLGYDINTMAGKLDYVILRTNELYFDTQGRAHFSSPLYTASNVHAFRTLSMNRSLLVWNQLGMPFSKIIVGFTGVGRLLELVNESDFYPEAPVTSRTLRGPLYNLSSGLAYPEICLMRNTSNRYFDSFRKSPFLVKGTTWVGYDDRESLKIKAEWCSQLGVAGLMFSGLDEDDFTGTMCGEGQYPLLSTMKSFFSTDKVTPTVSRPSTFAFSGTTQFSNNEKEPLMKSYNIFKFFVYLLVFLSGCLIGYIILCVWRRTQQSSSQ